MEMSSFILPKGKDSIGASLWIIVTQIILARYQYDGLDGTDIQADSIERSLMRSGYCCIYKDKSKKLIALPCVPTKFDIYGRPKVVTAYPLFSDTDERPYKTGLRVGVDCAVIINNAEMVSTIALVQPYIYRLSRIWKELGNNLAMSKVFALIGANSTVAKSIEEALKTMITDGVSVASISDVKAFLTNIEKLDFKVEYRQGEYHQDFDSTWQMLMTVLGINNVGTEKKERLLKGEVECNNELLDIITNTTRSYREDGLRVANEIFGTNIRIKEEKIEEKPKTEESEDMENEKKDGGEQ